MGCREANHDKHTDSHGTRFAALPLILRVLHRVPSSAAPRAPLPLQNPSALYPARCTGPEGGVQLAKHCHSTGSAAMSTSLLSRAFAGPTPTHLFCAHLSNDKVGRNSTGARSETTSAIFIFSYLCGKRGLGQEGWEAASPGEGQRSQRALMRPLRPPR